MKKKPCVFVVDDDPEARQSVTAIARTRGYDVREFQSADDYLDAGIQDQPGVIITDVRMEGKNGFDLLESLRERKCQMPIIVITGYGDVPAAVRAMQLGAMTFLEKPTRDQELMKQIEIALKDQAGSAESIARRKDITDKVGLLTEDERCVLAMLLSGYPNKRIAHEMDLGLRTVELRRSNIMKKLEATSLPDLVRKCIEVEFPVESIIASLSETAAAAPQPAP